MDTKKMSGLMDSVAGGMKRVIEPISTYLAYICAAFAMAMGFLVVIDIIMRFLFNKPIDGIIELETFMLAVLCFLSLAYTMIKGGHVSVDIFSSKLKGKFKLFLSGLFPLFGVFVFGVIAWQYVLKTTNSINLGEYSDVLNWPLWPFYAITALGCALICLVLVASFLSNLGRLLKTYPKAWPLIFLILIVASGSIAAPWLLKVWGIQFSPFVAGIFMITVMLVLLFLGLPVAFAMALVGILGIWYLSGFDVSASVIQMSVYDSVASYFFCVVPFFILMGFFCLKAGISNKLYEAGNKCFGQMPGGLAIGTIFGCGGFAAICGDSMATAATMGSVSLPEMKKYNYDDSLATGSVAAGGTLGILIPPSLGFIVYGIITEESVGKLFMAGVIPGILLIMLFAITIYVRCKLNPSLGPKAPKVSFREKLNCFRGIWPVLVLFILVMGGIYIGLFTPTEAGGVGMVGALFMAIILGGFNWKQFLEGVLSSMVITSMVAAILFGVAILGYFITMTEIPLGLADFISNLHVSRYLLFTLILLLYLVLGVLMNIIPMIMLTLPILFPTIVALGFDPIWFGVIMVIMMEMGQITPPVGINVFVIAGVAEDVPMGTIFKGILPFILVEILVIVILTIWPDIVMYMPNAMDVLPTIGD